MHFKKIRKIIKQIVEEKLKSITKDSIFSISIFLVVAIAIFFRLYNYTDRIFIQADNARDIQIARYAADHFKLPQIGQFSSAGPFFYGPWWYWILETVSFLPFGFLTHWYFITFLYLIFILLIYYVGKEIGEKWLGILAAIFAAISTTQINYSFSTWNPTIVPLLVLISLFFLIRFSKYKKGIDLFLLSFIVGLAITIHFQNILILPTLAVALFSQKISLKKYLESGLLIILGLLTPFIPLIYFDARFHWHNFISLFIYLTIDQYRIWIPNRWLTYTSIYWPKTWAEIIGGTKLISIMIISLLGLFSLIRIKRFAQYKIFYLVAITFFLEIILYRYYRGERYQYYTLFAHPYVILTTAWVVLQVFKFRQILGLAFITLICTFTIKESLKDLNPRGITLKEINSLKEEVYSKYPSVSFDIYGCETNAESISHPLALAIYYDGKNQKDGTKIGVCEYQESLQWSPLSKKDVNSQKITWFNKNTETVYIDTVEWWKTNPPQKGNGSFWEFIKEKLSPKCYPHC